MKKLKPLATCLLFSLLANNLAAQLQQIKIVSFTVKNQLPANIDGWISTPAALILVAQKVPGPIPIREPRLVVQIRSGGAVLCGNTPANARPIDPFDVRTFNTTDLTGFLTNCHELKAGTYTICVQFFNIDKVAISQEMCKEFKVEDASVEYSPPTLITPDNGKKISAQELQSVVMFRWTPLVPKPKEPVTYRLKVWQLMQGQNGTTAMRSNQPIVTKEVDNLTQATVSGIYNGPCKPPYLCDFIWNVQALNRSGKSMGNNNGTSEPYTFGVADEKGKGPDNVLPADKKTFTSAEAKNAVTFRWTPITPKPQESVTYRMKVWQLMQGQSGSQAMKTNQPIVTKDVDNITEANVSGIWTGPCRPPYLCDYIWEVEASTRQDGAAPKIIGTSNPTTFSVQEATTKCTENIFPEDKKQMSSKDAMGSITFKWKPKVGESPTEPPPTYRMKVWQLMQGQNGSTAMRTNQPIFTKDVDNITQATVSGIYTGPCRPPYLCDYIWSVEAASNDGRTSCVGEPTTFSIKEETKNCPVNLFPEDNKKINLKEAAEAITFKWNPTLPVQSPAYRLKVWQLMQGQNGSMAMKSNKPLIEKLVRGTTETTVNNILTGPCKPPYLCDFIWSVEAISANGQTTCSSEPSAFSITSGGCTATLKITKDSCIGFENGMYKHRVCATYTADPSNSCNILFNNPTNNTTNNFGMFQSAQSAIFCSRTPGTTTSNYTLPLSSQPNSLIPGASASFCFDLFVPLTATGVKFTAFGFCDDQTGNFNTANANDTIDVVPCICKECDKVKIEFPSSPTISESNNILSLAGGIIKASPKKVKRITADLVYFDIKTDENCWICNKNSATFGNFTSGTIQGSDFTTTMPGGHSVQWTNIGDADLSAGRPFSLNIAIPPTVACCDADINFCIRYIVMFEDCTVCNVKVCYSFKKDGCQK